MTAKLHAQITEWRKQLLDLSKRNRLINCRISARAAIEIEHPEPEVVWQQLVVANGGMTFTWKRDLLEEETDDQTPQLALFSEEETPDAPEQSKSPRSEMAQCLESSNLSEDDLLTQLADRALASRLSRLSLNAKTSVAEQGVNILYMAFGLLKWYESPDSDIALLSPLLLVPVDLQRAGPDAPWKIRLYEEEVVTNQSLYELLRSNFRLELPKPSEDGWDEPEERQAFLDKVRQAVQSNRAHPRWEVIDRVVLGTFSFQKLAMWQDLGNNANQIAAHDLCKAIGADETATFSDATDLPTPSQFDEKIHPTSVHTILDCDSSQFEAILAVNKNVSLVLDGPPGTGKSQTIANMIGEALANKKNVLFVSEKVAALEVVKRRLDARGLGDFCLECHSHKANKRDVITELGRCLAMPVEEYRDQVDDLEQLYTLRQKLNAYAKAIHQRQSALNTTPFAVHGQLARLELKRASRCPIDNVLAIDAATLREISEQLQGLDACRSVVDEYQTHPWRGCRIAAFSLTVHDDIQHDFQQLAHEIEFHTEVWAPLGRLGFFAPNPTRPQLEAAISQAEELSRYPEFPRAWFANAPRDVATKVLNMRAELGAQKEARAGLAAFRAEAIQMDCSALLTRVCDHSDPWLARAVRPGSCTVRELRRSLEEIADDLAKLRECVDGIASAIGNFSRALGIRIDTESSLGLLGKLTAVGQTVAKTGLMKASWFDDTRRTELQQVAAKCDKELVAARRLRSSLSQRMLDTAFENEGASIAEEAAALGPLWVRAWSWLSGRWSRFTRRTAALYRERPPVAAAELLADLQQVREYHEHWLAVCAEEVLHSNDLVRDEQGVVRWDAFFSGIDAISRLRGLIRIPDRLKQLLTTEGMIDRSALEAASATVATTLASMDAGVSSLNNRFSLARIGSEGRSYVDLSATAFAEWLGVAEAEVRNRVTAADELITLLQEGADVGVLDLVDCLSRLQDFRRRTQRMDDLHAELTRISGVPENRDEAAWEDCAQLARSLLTLLDSFGESPADHVVRAVSDRETGVVVSTAASRLKALVAAPGWATLGSCFSVTESISVGVVLDKISLAELIVWLRQRVSDIRRLQEWIRFREAEQVLERLKMSPVLREVLQKELPLEEAKDAFLVRFYRLWLDAIYAKGPVLRDFRVEDHERLLTEFRRLDRAAVEGTYKRIRASLLGAPERPHSGMLGAPATSEVGILMREVQKKKRHLALRQLFRKIPTLLTRLKPCVMMSPLAVSTYLDSPEVRFDLVIFDEASQVRPFDAIGAVYRGKQLVVAGDQKQLPPTSFFDRMVSDDDAGDADDEEEDLPANLGDFESILDVCCSIGLPRKRLRWHYRSRREPLIAFSNHHYYGNELATFPSVDDANSTTAVKFHFVANGRWRPGSGGGDNPEEARETAAVVFQCFEQFPEQSLGVITFNQKQQLSVLAELDKLQLSRPDMADFFNESRNEPFFVKNLENVQGDERDRIILSVGYGFDTNGKFAMRFGPLNRQGGERRLNVAVTRAKHQVILITSIHAHDVDLRKTQSAGARLLRAYLEYAERGPDSLGGEVSEDSQREADSPFECEVERELQLQGFNVRRQVGCGGFRIDLALVDPSHPGRYVLGVECDGATYHSSATARDRDRLRQEVLEGLGWKICRVWSTDWIRDPRRQIQRVVAAYNEALRRVSEDRREPVATEPISRTPEEAPIIRVRQDQMPISRPFVASSIDEVPYDVLDKAIIGVLRSFGQTTQDELIRAVARELGFQRTGRKIQERIAEHIATLTIGKRVKRIGIDHLAAM